MITVIFVFIAALIGKVLSKLLEEEAKAWLPHIVEKLVRRAVKRLPEAEQERFAEEWRADLNETPGHISKLLIALGFQIAASNMGPEFANRGVIAQYLLDITFGVLALVCYLPLMLLIAFLIKLENRGQCFLNSNGSI